MKPDELKKLMNTDIDAFLKETDKVFREGDFAEVVRVVGIGFEDRSIEMMAGYDAQSVPDAELGKVAREVYKWTEGERDIADLLGAAKVARCRMCKHAVYGALCGSEARRDADLAKGGVPEFCEMVGRDVLFDGEPCKFFEVGFGVDDEEDEVE